MSWYLVLNLAWPVIGIIVFFVALYFWYQIFVEDFGTDDFSDYAMACFLAFVSACLTGVAWPFILVVGIVATPVYFNWKRIQRKEEVRRESRYNYR